MCCLFLLLAACQTAVADPEIETVTAVLPTHTAVATETSLPTNTAVPTQTFIPLPTNTAPATVTAVPTLTPTATPSVTPTPQMGQACPNPAPAKPDYAIGVLGEAVWPTPTSELSEPHFWFIDPVQGGRKPLADGYYPYGWDGGSRFLLHNGSDFPQLLGTPVTAVADGTVIVAQADVEELFGWRCNWYGQLVVLELAEHWQDQPIYVLYGHVQNVQVEVGQTVKQGEVLAEIGVEGVSAVPHLHLEVRIGNNGFGDTVNPMLWLEPLPETAVLAGRLVDEAGRPWQGSRITLIKTSGEEAEFLNTFTYLDDPDHIINPDAGLAENFVFADLPAGFYTLFATVEGQEYRQNVELKAGEVTAVEIITQTGEVTP